MPQPFPIERLDLTQTAMSGITRRRWLQTTLPAAAALLAPAAWVRGAARLAPVETITRGPKHHWFGYYDKLQFDPSGQRVLGMQVDFEHRSPRPDDTIRIGLIDRSNNNAWVELGTSTAWCWQQGCMLQWLPGSSSQVVWNDRQRDRFVCRILDVETSELKTVPHAIYALAPDGKSAVSADFRRINDVRPGYGYAGLPDPYAESQAPAESGIFRVDLESGHQELIISLADVAALGNVTDEMKSAKHWFNHLLFNPDGTRFIFLHRWTVDNRRRRTRMLTAAADGSDIRVIDDNGLTSHFIWRDPRSILAWSEQPSHGRAFYLFEDCDQRNIEAIGPDVMIQDGHCSYLPDTDWILNDTYPDAHRVQHVYLYHVPSRRRVPLGGFPSPPEYTGEWRCDTHPRFSPDGTTVCIDSPLPDVGRQLHLIDIRDIVA